MTDTNHPNFKTAQDGTILIAEGDFEGTIFRYTDTQIDDTNSLKYNIDLQKLVVEGEDVTTTFTERNEAKFLNTVATPILTKIIEDIRKLGDIAKANEAADEAFDDQLNS